MNFYWEVFKILCGTTLLFFFVKEDALTIDPRFSLSVQVGVLLYGVMIMPFFALAIFLMNRKFYKSVMTLALLWGVCVIFIIELFIHSGFFASEFDISYMKFILFVYILGGYILTVIYIVIEYWSIIRDVITSKKGVHLK